jgi:peptidoglycan/LPS O-acetylase OafA/YrhL
MQRGAIPSLDGIRALAVLLVFLAHSGFEAIVPGGLGVTIFFVLSGYLISTLMRIEHASRGSVDFRNFYLRRLLRLMPPLLIVVAITALLADFGVIDGSFSAEGFLAALFYFGNYFLISQDFHGMPAGLGVVWSLAIEEHYYLLFPLLAAVLFHAGRRGLSAAILATLCVIVLAWRCWLAWHGASEDYLTMATDTRVDSILIGSLMALWCNPWLDRLPTWKPAFDAGLACFCAAVLLTTLLYRDEVFRVTIRHTLQSLAIAPLIYLAVARARQRPYCWLNARPLAYLGAISYTVYLTHHAILLGLAKHWPGLGWAGLTLAAALITLLVSEAMRRWVEQPCARLRQRLHGRRPSRGEPLPVSVTDAT